MRKTPFKYIDKAVQKRVKDLQQLIRSQYGIHAVPKVKITYTVKPHRHLASCGLRYTDEVLDEMDPSEPSTYDYTYRNYGHYEMTFNTYLLNDLKLPYVHDVVGHEFAHACVSHIIGMKDLIYNYSSYKKPQPHGPEFRKFCKLFDVSPGMSKAKGRVGHTSAKWNRTNGRPHKMWCCCTVFYASKKDFDWFMEEPYICPSCKEVVLPYGVEESPVLHIESPAL